MSAARLETFGIRMTGIRRGRRRQAFRDQLAAAGETDPVLRVIADGFIAAHATLCKAAAELDAIIGTQAYQHPVAQRLMTIPGLGPVVSLSFIALIDDPGRFGKILKMREEIKKQSIRQRRLQHQAAAA